MKRLKLIEEPFAAELDALHRGLPYYLSGPYASERMKLFKVVRRYTDELNKARKYACPLSTSILISSILEGVLFAKLLEREEAAAKTVTWQRAAEDKHRRQSAIPGIPGLTLAELIQSANELHLLKTTGVQQTVDMLILETLPQGLSLPKDLRDFIASESWDAKRNHQTLHSLRETRNAVHPLQLIDKEMETYQQFEESIWQGLRVLLLINIILDIKSPLNK
jgi:hypothetical protein